MKLMNHCGSRRSRIHIQIVYVTSTVASIGNARVKVIGHDVRTYFSLLYNYMN